MAWYRTGTIAVTNGNATVTGTGTAFVGVVKVGAGFNGPDGRRYEVATVVSNTELTITPTYLGTTASGQAYSVEPTYGIMAAVYDSLQSIISGFNSILTGIGIGVFPDGTLAAPAMRFASDGDTGWYRKASNALAGVAAGVERLLIGTTGITVTGLISGTAVTQTTTDTTTGRLLKVGDFGVGANAPVIGNASVTDNTIAPGVYTYNPASGSSGGATTSRGTLRHNRRGTGAEVQEIIYDVALDGASGPQAGDMFIRSRNTNIASGAWTAWSKVFDQSNIRGTVSESSGVPTGALIESGSNANGEYTRWADGTQMCWHSMAASSGGAATWTFPASFVTGNLPEVTGATQATVSSVFVLDAAPTVTAATFSARDKTDARRADTVRLMAVGRWF